MEALDKYLSKYNNLNNTRDCTDAETNSQIVENGKVKDESSEVPHSIRTKP